MPKGFGFEVPKEDQGFVGAAGGLEDVGRLPGELEVPPVITALLVPVFTIEPYLSADTYKPHLPSQESRLQTHSCS